MATFLVGPDDKTLFKSRTTWDFPDALESAVDGDTIELQSGFDYLSSEFININKNITIKGHLDDNNQTLNTISNISIKNGSIVTIANISIVNNIDNKVALFITEKSKAIISHAYVNGGKSNAINIIKNSSLDVKNSTVLSSDYPSIFGSNANIDISESVFNAEKTDAIYIKNNSSLALKNSSLSSKEHITVWSENSKININKTKILSTDKSNAKYSEKNSLYLDNTDAIVNGCSIIDSIDLVNSNFKSEKTIINKHLLIEKNSIVNADLIGILGIKDWTINLWSNNKSNIKIDKLLFGKESNPNIKLERNVEFKANQILYAQFNATDSNFIFEDNFLPKENDNIEYFGDKPALEKLDEMVGIKSVKEEIKEFIAITQMNKRREEQGISDSGSTLHSLFLGNPGTGKTTVARIVGKIFYEKGIISKDNFVETSRSDLVGQYIGNTAIKTRKVLESALGGVLFIDEAYTLYPKDSSKDFGIEAINEILKFMEDHRSDIVIIFAGYTKEMMDFLKSNPGLSSRIPNRFTFEDYSESELIQMGLKQLEAKKYKVSKDKYEELVHNNFSKSNDHSNGRWIRNFNEKVLRKTAVRLIDNENADLSEITDEDLENSML